MKPAGVVPKMANNMRHNQPSLSLPVYVLALCNSNNKHVCVP